MRAALDATPLLGRRTGIGRYVEHLVDALCALPPGQGLERLVLVPLSIRGGGLDDVLAGRPAARRGRRAPARLVRAWGGRLPLGDVLAGRVDVWHATNFVLPRTVHARGVVTVHDLTYLHHPEWVDTPTRAYRELVPAALRRAGSVCTVSATVRGELLDAYPWVDPARVVVTPNGLDRRFLSPTGAAPEGLPSQFVLFVGTREPRKGLDTLVGAYRHLLRRGERPPPLVVVGGTGWGPDVDLAGLPDGLVRLLDYVPAPALPPLLSAATLLAFPSRYEGFGLPPLEALAAGTPVLASDLPVLREVLGGHAAYAPADDAPGWADALTAALAAGDGGPDAVAARRAHAAAYTWQRCAERTLDAYRLAAD